jgi:short-subunit dehydrogenase
VTFAGRKIWIIGASSGIGRALAEALAARGAKLVLSARDAVVLAEVAQRCNGAEVLPLDLATSGDFRRAAGQFAPQSLDGVICTAALYDPGRVADLDADRLEALVRVNLIGSFEIAQAAPALLRPQGQLVLFGSVAGYIGLPKGQPYSASKAAIINLAESLRIELAPQVDVRLVCPGFVRSRLTDKNDFQMPAIITAEVAAEAVIRGLSGRSFEIHFPRRFTLAMKLLRALPYALSLRLTGRLG